MQELLFIFAVFTSAPNATDETQTAFRALRVNNVADARSDLPSATGAGEAHHRFIEALSRSALGCDQAAALDANEYFAIVALFSIGESIQKAEEDLRIALNPATRIIHCLITGLLNRRITELEFQDAASNLRDQSCTVGDGDACSVSNQLLALLANDSADAVVSRMISNSIVFVNHVHGCWSPKQNPPETISERLETCYPHLLLVEAMQVLQLAGSALSAERVSTETRNEILTHSMYANRTFCSAGRLASCLGLLEDMSEADASYLSKRIIESDLAVQALLEIHKSTDRSNARGILFALRSLEARLLKGPVGRNGLPVYLAAAANAADLAKEFEDACRYFRHLAALGQAKETQNGYSREASRVCIMAGMRVPPVAAATDHHGMAPLTIEGNKK